MNLTDAVRKISGLVENSSQEMQNFFIQMLKIKSVNPKGGGTGEGERAGFLEDYMNSQGFQVTRVDVKDEESGSIIRPNLSTKVKGSDNSRTLWFISHMDTVPEGSLELWRSDPFEPIVSDGKIVARGAEDNGQSLVATLFALKTLAELKVDLPLNVGVWFVADEEAGSRYGAKFLLKNQYFKNNDVVVVPDAGSPDGSRIEIAEKSLLWLKFTVFGKQVHASTPQKGINANRIGMKLAIDIDEALHGKYDMADGLFNEPHSTFEPTKREANVSNVNTIPGLDTLYFDCRVLPQYSLDDILSDVRRITSEYETRYGCTISVNVEQREDAGPATSQDSEVATILARAIATVYGIKPTYIGIGGQTVGNLFRKSGISTAVWSTIDEVAHEPNEYSKINNLLNDTKVFALLPLFSYRSD